MFAYLWETVQNDAGSPKFHVQSLPGALCHLTRNPNINSVPEFSTVLTGASAGWAVVTWSPWTATGSITVYATCHMSSGPSYQSNSVVFTWPPATPPPATPPPATPSPT